MRRKYRTPAFWISVGIVPGLVIGLLLGGYITTAWFGTTKGEDTRLAAAGEAIEETADPAPVAKKGQVPEPEVSTEVEAIAEEADSLPMHGDSVAEYGIPTELEEFIVVEDELLFRTTLFVANDSISKPEPDLNIDSLLIDDENQYSHGESYRVEFWASPINYHGFRLQKGKLLLYGIDHFEDASLWRLGEKLYLRYHGMYYLLEESPYFHQLIPVSLPEVEQ